MDNLISIAVLRTGQEGKLVGIALTFEIERTNMIFGLIIARVGLVACRKRHKTNPVIARRRSV